jgi:hypothetical protein
MIGGRGTALSIVTALVAGLYAGVLTAPADGAPAAKARTVVFSATYTGRAVVLVSGEMADLKATGKGTGTVVKKSTIVGTGKGYDSSPCEAFFGTSTIKAADGSTLRLALSPQGGKACPGAEESKNALSGAVVVKGGTKTFARARGTLKMTGNYDRGRGTFTITLKGKLTY